MERGPRPRTTESDLLGQVAVGNQFALAELERAAQAARNPEGEGHGRFAIGTPAPAGSPRAALDRGWIGARARLGAAPRRVAGAIGRPAARLRPAGPLGTGGVASGVAAIALAAIAIGLAIDGGSHAGEGVRGGSAASNGGPIKVSGSPDATEAQGAAATGSSQGGSGRAGASGDGRRGPGAAPAAVSGAGGSAGAPGSAGGSGSGSEAPTQTDSPSSGSPEAPGQGPSPSPSPSPAPPASPDLPGATPPAPAPAPEPAPSPAPEPEPSPAPASPSPEPAPEPEPAPQGCGGLVTCVVDGLGNTLERLGLGG